MMSLIFTLLPLLLIAYYFYGYSKYKDVSFELKCGSRCLSCKDKIEGKDDDIYAAYIKPKLVDNFDICLSCKRDESINKIVGRKKILSDRVKKFLIKSIVIEISLMILILIFATINIVCLFMDLKGFGITLNIINTLYWTFLIVKFKIKNIKKPSQ